MFLEQCKYMGDQLKYSSSANAWLDGFFWDVKFPSKFQENSLRFFAQVKGYFSDHFIVSNATQLFNSARCLNLGHFQWSDFTLVGLPNRFKHFVFLIQMSSGYSLIAIRQ